MHIAFLGFGASLLLTAFASTQLISSSVSSSASASSSIGAILGVAQFLRAIGSSMYSGTDMAFLYEIIQKYGNNSDCDSDCATNGNNNGSSKNNKKKKTTGTNIAVVDVNTLLLQIESRNIFYTTSTEAIVAALGGWIAKRVGLPTVVALSSIPFLVGAILSLFLQDCSNKSSSQQRRPTATATAALAVITSSPTQPQVEPPIPVPLPRILPRKTSLATFPTIAPSGLSRSNRNLTNINVNENESNTIIQFFRTAITKIHVYVPTKLWTLFFVGVVLNCATYVASTALNPLLWELVGIPIAQFGTLHAGCGAISAIGALTAPTIRTFISSLSTIIIRKSKRRTNSNSTISDNDTEGLLLFMLCTSAVAYGLMTLSAIIRLQIFTTLTNASTSSSSNSHSTATTSSIGCAILASFLLSLVRGLAWPVLGSAINTAVTHNNSRATTLSLFSGSIKVGMVVTGMVLGALFNTQNSNTNEESNSNQVLSSLSSSLSSSNNNMAIGKGLLQGCSLCGIVLVITATWLAGKGLSESVSVSTPSLTSSAPPHLSAAIATTPSPISTNNGQEQPQESKKEQ